MKQKISVFLLIVFTLTFTLPAFAAEVNAEKQILTLEEVQQLAVENSRSLDEMALSLEQADRQVRILKNDLEKLRYGSSVEVYDAIQTNEEIKQSLEDLKDPLDPNDPTDQLMINNIETQLSIVNKSIMDLSQQRASISSSSKQLKDAKEQAEDNQEDLERMQADLKKQVKHLANQYYFQILELQDLIELMEKQYSQYLKLIKIERVKQEIGLAITTDVDKIAVIASTTGKQLKSTKENQEILKRLLNDLMGRETDAPLQLVRYQVPESIIPGPPYSKIIDQVKDNYYELYKLERNIENLEEDLDDTDGSNEELIAEAEVEKAKLKKQKEVLNLENNVKSILTDYEDKTKTYQLAQLSYRTAKQNYDWDKKKYDLGMISQIQMNDSEIKYLEALNNKLKAGYNYYLAKNKLELAKEGVILSSGSSQTSSNSTNANG